MTFWCFHRNVRAGRRSESSPSSLLHPGDGRHRHPPSAAAGGLVILGAGCGLRLGEALGLKVGRIRFLERELDVIEQLALVPGAPPRMAPPKTRGSIRTV